MMPRGSVEGATTRVCRASGARLTLQQLVPRLLSFGGRYRRLPASPVSNTSWLSNLPVAQVAGYTHQALAIGQGPACKGPREPLDLLDQEATVFCGDHIQAQALSCENLVRVYSYPSWFRPHQDFTSASDSLWGMQWAQM